MRRVILVITLSGVLTTGCASRPGAAPGVAAPTMLANPRPNWQLPPGRNTGVVLDLRISVRVDTAGRPIIETLQVTGLGATDNREAAVEWVRTARFRPAQQAGHPVEGLFQTRVQARSAVRRMGVRDADAGAAPPPNLALLQTAAHRCAV